MLLKMKYEIYYVDKKSRIECMLIFSLMKKIDWCEDGLKIVTWEYTKIAEGNADNLNQIFKKHSILNIDHRKKKQTRSINIGDIIFFDEEPWIISSFGFRKIPDILWKKIYKK